jgi:O-acetyl-ADP-ribose deacetylase (regulator of RNase III)
MQEISGDLWSEHARGAVVAITTNGTVDKVGRAIMLRGCARQAREQFPDILKTLGTLIRHHGNHVFDLGHQIVSFPIEENPYQVPEPRLIEQSCRELVELADYKGWRKIVVPRPGCGSGGLQWSDVRKILARHLDERFHIITMKEDADAKGEIR